MANCCNCSAPLPPDSIKCEYCGSRNDIDLKAVHYNTTHQCESQRTCPRCSIRLDTIDLQVEGKFLIERCRECLGLFFDPGELEALLQATVSNVYVVNRGRLDSLNAGPRPAEYPVSYIKCPACSNLMNRVNFGAKSGVVVNRCKEHGVWLDGGELRRLFEWMKAGGQILDQERKEQHKKSEAEQERERRRALAGSAGNDPDYPVFDSGGLFRQGDPDIFDIVLAAARFFMK